MLKYILSATMSLCVLSSTAFANVCDGSTMEMTGCFLSKALKSQEEINASTKELKAILDNNKQSGDGEPADYKKAKNSLDKANQNYTEFVASQCAIEGNLETMTGTIATIVRAECTARLTQQRASYLKKLVEDYKTSN